MYKLEHSSLVAVMRNDPVKLADFAGRHNVPKTYTDASLLINDPEVDIVYVATPPDTHLKYALEVLAAGKHVYVEKPMAMDHAQCMEMVDAARSAGRKLFVAYNRRALPYFLKIRQLLDEGAIGEAMAVEVTYIRPESDVDGDPLRRPWRLKKEVGGEGYFYDLAPHTLDILDFLLGEITDAAGHAVNKSGLYDVADTVSATLRFGSGVCGTGLWCFAAQGQPRQDSVVITGRRGRIKFNSFLFDPIELHSGDRHDLFPIDPPEHIQQHLIGTIIDELRGKGTCPSTGVSAARTSRVMDMILNRGQGCFPI
jgi:predicted dehydrogenase